MNELPASVRWSEQAYRRLIRVYPSGYRREFGEPMVQVFCDMALDAHRQRGPWGLVRVWFRTLVDLACSVFVEYARIRNRRPEMKTALYAVGSILLAIVVQYVFMMLIGLAILWVVIGGIVAESPSQPAPHWVHLLECLMFFLPALLAPMILMHTRPVYRPWLTAPVGAMTFFAFAFFTASTAPWWGAVLIIAVGGGLSLAGCYLGSRIPPRRRNDGVPLSSPTAAG